MSDTWFYTLDGRNRLGPCPLMLMQLFVQTQVIQPGTHVLRPGEKRWQRADAIPELFAVADVLPADAPMAPPTAAPVTPAAPAAQASPARSRLTGTWGGTVINDAGETESEAFVFSAAGNLVHGYQGRDGRPVFVEVTHVGQVIEYASPKSAGRLTVQALTVTPTGVAWSAQDYSVKSGGLATPGSYVVDRTTNGVTSWESQLRGEELDVATLSQWSSSQTDNIRDFGGGGATLNFGGQNQIWKRGTLRKVSDDPMYLLRRFGG
jgi:hypothetical protein